MAELIKKHMPNETLSVVEIARESKKEFPKNMRFTKAEKGVWAVRSPNSMTIFRMIEGEAIELD